MKPKHLGVILALSSGLFLLGHAYKEANKPKHIFSRVERVDDDSFRAFYKTKEDSFLGMPKQFYDEVIEDYDVVDSKFKLVKRTFITYHYPLKGGRYSTEKVEEFK